MKTFTGLFLIIPIVLLGTGGVGGFLVGYMPSAPMPLDQSLLAKNIILFGGYGAGGKGDTWFGGIGFGGESTLSVNNARYVYSISAGGPLFEYGKWLGSFVKVSVGAAIGGMGERLMRWKDGGDTAEDFINGTSQGYVFVDRTSYFAMPMAGISVKLRFMSISVYGSWLFAYSRDGWTFDEGKPVLGQSSEFLNQWMVLGGIAF